MSSTNTNQNKNIINIRKETPEDYHKVEEITRNAFWNLYFPGCNEHVVVHKLRQHRDFLPDLTFVIELNDNIVGSIFYSKSKIVFDEDDNKEDFPTIYLGPVSIDPKYHRQGLGRKLIQHSIDEAKKQGHKAIMVMGYPYHYKPYGFVGSKKYGITASDGNYYIGQQALELEEGALHDVKGGKFIYASGPFEPSQEEVDEYDKKNFPPKVKAVQPSQKEFEITSKTIDES